MKIRAVLLTVGTIILLIVSIFAGSIGLFSPMWWPGSSPRCSWQEPPVSAPLSHSSTAKS